MFTTLPLGRNHEGSQKIEGLIYQDLYNTPPYLSLPLILSLFHPIDPISWQSDLHLMQQQLFDVLFVFAGFVCVWSLSLPSCKPHFLYQIQQTFTLTLKIHLYHSPFLFLYLPSPLFISIHPLLSLFLTLSPSIYSVLCYASSLICAEQADPSLPQHASIDPLPQCVCVILRCSDL